MAQDGYGSRWFGSVLGNKMQLDRDFIGDSINSVVPIMWFARITGLSFANVCKEIVGCATCNCHRPLLCSCQETLLGCGLDFSTRLVDNSRRACVYAFKPNRQIVVLRCFANLVVNQVPPLRLRCGIHAFGEFAGRTANQLWLCLSWQGRSGNSLGDPRYRIRHAQLRTGSP